MACTTCTHYGMVLLKAAGGAGVGAPCPRRRAVPEDSPGSDLPENQHDMAGTGTGTGRGVCTITIPTGLLLKDQGGSLTGGPGNHLSRGGEPAVGRWQVGPVH